MKRGDRELTPELRANAVRRARELRKTMSPPERRQWTVLRRKTLAGFRFRRQCPVGPFVLDFYRAQAALAVLSDEI